VPVPASVAGKNPHRNFGFPPMTAGVRGRRLQPVAEPSIIERSVEKAHVWLDEVAQE
jgi:hypothetical protein